MRRYNRDGRYFRCYEGGAGAEEVPLFEFIVATEDAAKMLEEDLEQVGPSGRYTRVRARH